MDINKARDNLKKSARQKLDYLKMVEKARKKNFFENTKEFYQMAIEKVLKQYWNGTLYRDGTQDYGGALKNDELTAIFNDCPSREALGREEIVEIWSPLYDEDVYRYPINLKLLKKMLSPLFIYRHSECKRNFTISITRKNLEIFLNELLKKGDNSNIAILARQKLEEALSNEKKLKWIHEEDSKLFCKFHSNGEESEEYFKKNAEYFCELILGQLIENLQNEGECEVVFDYDIDEKLSNSNSIIIRPKMAFGYPFDIEDFKKLLIPYFRIKFMTYEYDEDFFDKKLKYLKALIKTPIKNICTISTTRRKIERFSRSLKEGKSNRKTLVCKPKHFL